MNHAPILVRAGPSPDVGVWDRLLKQLRQEADMKELFIRSTPHELD